MKKFKLLIRRLRRLLKVKLTSNWRTIKLHNTQSNHECTYAGWDATMTMSAKPYLSRCNDLFVYRPRGHDLPFRYASATCNSGCSCSNVSGHCHVNVHHTHTHTWCFMGIFVCSSLFTWSMNPMYENFALSHISEITRWMDSFIDENWCDRYIFQYSLGTFLFLNEHGRSASKFICKRVTQLLKMRHKRSCRTKGWQ